MAQVSKVNQLSMSNIPASNGKKSSGTGTSFSDIMSASNPAKQNDNNSKQVSQPAQAKAKLEDGKSSFKKIDQPDSKDYQDVQSNAGNDVDKTDNVTVTDDTTVTDVAEEAATELVDALKEQIADILGISKEELEKIMAESGFAAMDLIQPDVLKSLVLQVNGTSEVTDLLTNETMCNQLADLLQSVDEFIQTNDMQQFAAECDTIQNQDFAAILNQKNPLSEKTDEVNNVETPVEEVSQKAPVKEPVITVQKEVTAENEESYAQEEDSKEEAGDPHAQLSQFVQKLNDSVQGTGNVTEGNLERLQQMQQIVEQVVERIKVTLSHDTTSMELQLNPENLGKVNVSVLAKNGEMTATFTVENQLAKEALESQMTTLKDNLNEQGIKVDAIEVTVAQHGFSQNDFSEQGNQQFHNQAKRSGNLRKMREDNDLEEEAEEEPVPSVMGTGTVDFSA